MSEPRETLLRALSREVVEALEAFVDEALSARLGEAVGQLPSRWLTVEQAAQYLGTTPKAIRGRIERGRLPVVRDGRRVYIDRLGLDEAFATKANRGVSSGRPTHKSPRTADTAGGVATGGLALP